MPRPSFLANLSTPAFSESFFAIVDALNPLFWIRQRDSSGTTAVDQQGNHDGVYSTVPASPTLGIPGSLTFDNGTAVFYASGAHMSIPHDAALDFSGDHGIGFLLNFQSSGLGLAYGKFDFSGTFKGPTIFVNLATVGDIAFRQNSTETVVSTVNGMDDSKIRHFFLVRRALTQEIYINGLLDNTSIIASVTNSTEGNDAFVMGRPGPLQSIGGAMSELTGFDFAPSASEILDIANAALGTALTAHTALVASDGAVLHYRYNESTGTSAIEEISGLSGTYNGAPFLGRGGLLPKDSNKTMSLDGVNDFMELNNAASRITGDLTLGTVANYISFNSTAPNFLADLISQGNIVTGGSMHNKLYGLFVRSTGEVGYIHQHGDHIDEIVNFGYFLSTLKFNYLHLTRDVTLKELKLYCNRILVSTKSYVNQPFDGSATILRVGASTESLINFTHGAVDETHITPSVLTATQIAAQGVAAGL